MITFGFVFRVPRADDYHSSLEMMVLSNGTDQAVENHKINVHSVWKTEHARKLEMIGAVKSVGHPSTTGTCIIGVH